MHKIDVAGLKIDSLTKQEFINQLIIRLKSGKTTFISTPYSEFLYRSLRDPKLLETLNRANFAVPDGIGIFWAAKFLSIPLSAKSYYGKIFQAWWQAKYTLWSILFYPSSLRGSAADSSAVASAKVDRSNLNHDKIASDALAMTRKPKLLQEKIPGSELIWDLTRLAIKENKKIFLLGGFGNTPKIVADKLKALGAQVEWSNKNPDDASIINDIKGSGADFLFVAYGPIRQEQWIAQNMGNLPCKLYIGLGGTFDYIAQKQPNPPRFVRFMGLEWLFRLVTQPKRVKRIWQATFGLVMALIRYKVFTNLPYRKNVVSIVLNNKNEILIGRRNPRDLSLRAIGDVDAVNMKDYWQFSQGGIDGTENIETAARREIKEELNITSLEYIKTSEQIRNYDWHNAVRPLLGNYYKYRGQKQNIVYFRFTGSDEEIKPDHEEFIEYKWVTLNELITSVHDQRKELAVIAVEDLKDLT